MIESDLHKKALEKLDRLIDPVHIEACEQLNDKIWAGEELDYLPCVMGFGMSPEMWPKYSFTERWNDVEKNFISGMAGIYAGALIKDDRLYALRPDFGVVNIPELFGIPSILSDEGNSMSEGLNDIDKVRELIANGLPDLNHGHNQKVVEFEDFAKTVLSQYENLSKYVHPVLPDTQGPFDLACLIWGSSILTGLYDKPWLVKQMMELVTEAFIAYNILCKKRVNEAMDSAYHIGGLKIVRGGIRICDDSASLVSADIYRNFIKPYNIKAFKPFKGGWLHYCGNGNHLIDEMLNMEGVHVVHMGNPDMHNFLDCYEKANSKNIVMWWSGHLNDIGILKKKFGLRRILVLAENRYAAKDLADARHRLELVRNCKTIEKALY